MIFLKSDFLRSIKKLKSFQLVSSFTPEEAVTSLKRVKKQTIKIIILEIAVKFYHQLIYPSIHVGVIEGHENLSSEARRVQTFGSQASIVGLRDRDPVQEQWTWENRRFPQLIQSHTEKVKNLRLNLRCCVVSHHCLEMCASSGEGFAPLTWTFFSGEIGGPRGTTETIFKNCTRKLFSNWARAESRDLVREVLIVGKHGLTSQIGKLVWKRVVGRERCVAFLGFESWKSLLEMLNGVRVQYLF